MSKTVSWIWPSPVGPYSVQKVVLVGSDLARQRSSTAALPPPHLTSPAGINRYCSIHSSKPSLPCNTAHATARPSPSLSPARPATQGKRAELNRRICIYPCSLSSPPPYLSTCSWRYWGGAAYAAQALCLFLVRIQRRLTMDGHALLWEGRGSGTGWGDGRRAGGVGTTCKLDPTSHWYKWGGRPPRYD